MARNPAFTRVLYVTAAADNTWFNPTIGLNDSPDYATAPDKANAVAQCETIVSERTDGTEIGVPVQATTLASW